MKACKKPLFAFDLRIQKQDAKLCVYEDDFLEDLIERFAKLVKMNEKSQHRVKDKLENQLRKLLSNKKCSEKVKDKIEQFLDESKLSIIGVIQTEDCQQQINQTPLKALQQNSIFTKQFQVENFKQVLPQSYNVSPCLIKYASKQILVEEEQEKSIEQILQKYARRQNLSRPYEVRPSQSKENIPIKTYQHQQSNQALTNLKRDKITRSLSRSEIDYGKSDPNQNVRQARQTNHRRKYSASSLYNGYEDENLISYESYESYKMQRCTKQTNIIKQPSRQCLKRLYPENIKPSKSTTAFKYDNPTEYRTKFDYDKCLQAKGITGGFKQNKKFKYLG